MAQATTRSNHMHPTPTRPPRPTLHPTVALPVSPTPMSSSLSTSVTSSTRTSATGAALLWSTAKGLPNPPSPLEIKLTFIDVVDRAAEEQKRSLRRSRSWGDAPADTSPLVALRLVSFPSFPRSLSAHSRPLLAWGDESSAADEAASVYSPCLTPRSLAAATPQDSPCCTPRRIASAPMPQPVAVVVPESSPRWAPPQGEPALPTMLTSISRRCVPMQQLPTLLGPSKKEASLALPLSSLLGKTGSQKLPGPVGTPPGVWATKEAHDEWPDEGCQAEELSPSCADLIVKLRAASSAEEVLRGAAASSERKNVRLAATALHMAAKRCGSRGHGLVASAEPTLATVIEAVQEGLSQLRGPRDVARLTWSLAKLEARSAATRNVVRALAKAALAPGATPLRQFTAHELSNALWGLARHSSALALTDRSREGADIHAFAKAIVAESSTRMQSLSVHVKNTTKRNHKQ